MVLLLFLMVCYDQQGMGQHMNGLTIVGAPEPYETDPYPRIAETQADWICLVPYGFTRPDEAKVTYHTTGGWWGEREDGLRENIRLAREQGFKIFLKPQIYIPGSWPGGLEFDHQGWEAWEEDYRAFILRFARLAEELALEMLCVGTEFKVSEQTRPQFWRSLIEEIRCVYSGKLTYSSNWDSYKEVTFWEDLDYIGVSAYFPLDDSTVPRPQFLKKSWSKVKKELRRLAYRERLKVIFTEYGYLSVDGCAGRTWELEKKVHQLPINEQAQATSLDMLYAQLWEEDFWAGGFLWKWFPNDQGHEGYIAKDYTPKNKQAEAVIKKWFAKDRKSEENTIIDRS